VENYSLNNKGEKMSELSNQLDKLSYQAQQLSNDASNLAFSVMESSQGHGDFLVFGFTVLILSCFVGYYVVWSVTPALHSPLMGVTNAISSVIIVGALLAAGPIDSSISKIFGLVAVALAAVNIFGGFVVTNRMLSMFKKKQ
jgi:NAD(P) transhydrogenase subunit alpha